MLLKDGGVLYTHRESDAKHLGFTPFTYNSQHVSTINTPEHVIHQHTVWCRNRAEFSLLISRWNEGNVAGFSPWIYT